MTLYQCFSSNQRDEYELALLPGFASDHFAEFELTDELSALYDPWPADRAPFLMHKSWRF